MDMYNLNINRSEEDKIFSLNPDIQNKKDLLSQDILKIKIKLSICIIQWQNMITIIELDTDFYKQLNLKFNNIISIKTHNNYFFLILSDKILSYNLLKDFNLMEEYKINNYEVIKKIINYNNYWIIMYQNLIKIVEIKPSLEIINKYEIDKEDNYIFINNYENILVFSSKNYIYLVNLNNNFEEIKKINHENIIKLKIYKNWLIIQNHNKIEFINLKENYKIVKSIDILGNNIKKNFKINNNKLYIINDIFIDIYNLENFSLEKNIKLFNTIKLITFYKELLIIYDFKMKIQIVDYDIDYLEIFELNKNYDINFWKIYKNNLFLGDKNSLKRIKISYDLKVLKEVLCFNPDLLYKSYFFNLQNNYIEILENSNNYNIIYKSEIYNEINISMELFDIYLIIFANNYIDIINLEDNFKKIDKIEFNEKIIFKAIYDKFLIIALSDQIKFMDNNFTDIKLLIFTKKIISIKKFANFIFIFFSKEIKILNIKNYKEIKKLDFYKEIKNVKVYDDILIIIFDNLTILLDTINNISIQLNPNFKDIIVINNLYYILYSKNIEILDKNKKFEVIYRINLDEVFDCFRLHKNLLFLANSKNLVIYLKNFNNKLIRLKKFYYKYIDDIIFYQNYFLLKIYNELIIFNIKNKSFNIIKEYNFEKKIINIKIFNGLVFILFGNLIKILRINQFFQEIREINLFDDSIYDIKFYFNIIFIWAKNKVFVFDFNFYNKINNIFLNDILYDYYLKLSNFNDNMDINLRTFKKFFDTTYEINDSFFYNFIMGFNEHFIKNTQNSNFLKNSLKIFGYDKLFYFFYEEFSIIKHIIKNNKVSIFLKPLINYFNKYSYKYEIDEICFTKILNIINNDYQTLNIFLDYIYQKSIVETEILDYKLLNLKKYKIISYHMEELNIKKFKKYFRKYDRNAKIKFEIWNLPFKINVLISKNYRLFRILYESNDIVKLSKIKYLIYFFYDQIKMFQINNLLLFMILKVSLTISIVNWSFPWLITYLIMIIYFLIYELFQIGNDTWLFFRNKENIFDILLIIYNFIIFFLIFFGNFRSTNVYIIVLYYLNGIKFFILLKSLKIFSKMVRIFFNVIEKTIVFIIFLVFILIYFSNINFIVNLDNFNKFYLSLFNVYGQMLGNFDDNFSQYQYFDFFELIINSYCFNIILLNLFITIISDQFEHINSNSELYEINEKIISLQEYSSVSYLIEPIWKFFFYSKHFKNYLFFVLEKKDDELEKFELVKKNYFNKLREDIINENNKNLEILKKKYL